MLRLCSGAFLRAEGNPGVEERLPALEHHVQALEQENGELRKQLGAPRDGTPLLLQPGGRETKLVVGGFLQGQAEFGRASDPRGNGVRDRFSFAARASIWRAALPRILISRLSSTFRATRSGRARANEIYLNWRKYSFANLRFGQLKPAFGGEALASDTNIFTGSRRMSGVGLTWNHAGVFPYPGEAAGGDRRGVI